MQDSNWVYEGLLFDPASQSEYRVLSVDNIISEQPTLRWTAHYNQSHRVTGYETPYYEIGSRYSCNMKNTQASSTPSNQKITCHLYFYKVEGARYTRLQDVSAGSGVSTTVAVPEGTTHYKCTFTKLDATSYLSAFYQLTTNYTYIFDESSIISIRREDGIFTSDTDEIKLGQVIIGQLELSLKTDNKNFIPRGGCLKPYIRLKKGNNKSDWYPQGEYYISTRSYDKETGVLTIHAFDILRKSEVEMYTDEGDQGNWPMTDINTVNTIAARLDVSVDSRTTALMDQEYMIQYPGYKSDPDAESEEGYYTIREILGFIGAMYGGSWIISDEGKLRLIQFLDMPSAGDGYLINERGARIIFGNNAILV